MLNGTVRRIGWSDSYILAWRQPNSSSDGSGWMVVDMRSKKIKGPFSDEELDQKKEKIPALRAIHIYDTGEAWERLPRFF